MNAHLNAIVAWVVLGVLASSIASGGAWIWDGGSLVDSNWTRAENWDSNTVPSRTNVTEIDLNGETRPFPVVDTHDPWVLESLHFKGGAGEFALTGNELKFAATSAGDAIVNDSWEAQVISNPVTLDGTGAKTVRTAYDDLTLNGNVLLNVTGVFRGDANTFINGAISGAGDLEKDDSGVVTLTGANTYAGTTTIRDGTLKIKPLSGGSLPDTTDVTIESGASLDFDSETGTIDALSGAGGVANAYTLTVGADDGSATFSGSLASSCVGFVKTGAGTQVLSQANDHTGVTLADEGVLKVRHGGALGDSGDDASCTRVAFSGILELAGGITVSGEVLKLDGSDLAGRSATLQSTGNNTWDGPIDLQDIAIIHSNSGALVLGKDISGSGADLTLAGPGEGWVVGAIKTGAGTVTKEGAGTWRLKGAGTYTGNTIVNAGRLRITDNLGLGTSGGTTTVLSGATLEIQDDVSVAAEALTIGGTGVSGHGAMRNVSGDNTWGGAITLTGDTTVTSAADSLTLGSGAFISGGDYELILNGAGNGTAGGAISIGAGSVVKNGAGTWTLGGVNTYSGGTTVHAGVLQIDADDRMPDNSALTIEGGTFKLQDHDETIDALNGAGGTVNLGAGTLTVGAGGGDGTYSGTISGTGGLGKIGSGRQTLSGSCLYSGETEVRAGVLRLESSKGLIPQADGVTVKAGAVLELEGDIAWDEPLTLNGQGILNTGALRSIDGTTLWGGTVTLASDSVIQSDAKKLTFMAAANSITGDGKNLTLQGAGDGDIAGTITIGAGELTKKGAGTWKFSGSNTYTGQTKIEAGTLIITDDDALGATTYDTVVSAGGMLWLKNDITVPEPMRLNGSGFLGQGALRNWSGDNTLTGTIVIDSNATIRCRADSTLTILGNVFISADDLTLGGEGGAQISGEISAGGGALIKRDLGTWVLDGDNTYWSETRIEDGVLRIEHNNGLGGTGSGTTVAGGGALQLRRNIDVGTERLSLQGSGIAGTGALRSVERDNSWAGEVQLRGNSTIGVDAGTLTISGNIRDEGGSFSLMKVGAGTLRLTGTNTYEGATIIVAGTLQEGSGELPDSSDVTVLGGAIFDLNGNTDTIDALAGGGTVKLGGGTLTVGGDNGGWEFTGTITGAGGLTKIGTGTQVLGGDNDYTGETTVAAGVLNVRADTALGGLAAGTTVSSGAALELQGGVSVGAEALAISGAGIAGNGALRNISGINSFGGALTLGGDTTIQSDAGELRFTVFNPITGADANLVLAGAGDGTIGGAIATGAGGLTKNGTGAWTLIGGNTFSGPTAVNAGVLRIGSGGGLGTPAGEAAISDGAALEVYNGISVGTEDLAVTGAGIGGSGVLRSTSGTNLWAGRFTMIGDSTIGVDADTLTITGSMRESGGSRTLTKTGAGTLVLQGVIKYTGDTNVEEGELVFDIGGDSALGPMTTAGAGRTAALEVRRGTLTVTGDVGDGGGTSRLRVDNGTMTIGAGLTVDNLRVGFNGGAGSASAAGATRVGASGDLDVGRRTLGNAPTFGTLDLGAATSVTANLDKLRVGTIIATGGLPPQPVQGTLKLSQSGDNTLNATTIVAGDSAFSDNTMATSAIHLGETNRIRADSVTIARRHSSATADILAGGTCDLAGRSGAEADLFIGDNITESGGVSVGLVDLTGGEFNATLDELVLGRHGNGFGGGQGTLIVDAGAVSARRIDMGWAHATGLSLAPQNSTGTLTMRGGDFDVSGDVTTYSGLGALNLHGGTLRVGGDVATVASGPTGPGTMTINQDGGVLDLTGGSMNLGPVSPPGFSFTGGVLKDVGTFGDTLNQGLLVMGLPVGDGTLAPGGSIGSTAIEGDYNLISGSLEIEIQSPGGLAGTDYDLVQLTGPASIANLDGALDIVLLGGYVPPYMATFDVVTANSILFGPDFALDASGAPMPGGRYFDVDVVLVGEDQTLRLFVVPEPATLSLLVLGALALMQRRRNPRQRRGNRMT